MHLPNCLVTKPVRGARALSCFEAKTKKNASALGGAESRLVETTLSAKLAALLADERASEAPRVVETETWDERATE